jgi:hypothetical protein
MTKKFNNSLGLVFDKLGLVLSPVICKLLGCLHQAAEQGLMIPCALLKGVPGAGKTSTAEAFALAVNASKFFYQCNPGTGFDQLIGQPNLGAVLRQDAAACISDGILIQAAKAAMAGEDVVLILDEIDKTSPEVDAYLLDFLQSRRIHDSNMEELVVPSDVKFWVFLTSNDERELSDALMRRVRRITVDRPSRSTVANVLGIQEDAALLDVWDLTEKLAISQLRSYLEDGGDPQDLDLDILSQYVDDLPDLSTLAEQKAELSVDPEVTVVPATVRVSFYDKGNVDLISKLGSFKWFPESNDDILVEVPSLAELIRLVTILPENMGIKDFPYYNTEGSEDHRMVIDLIKPVVFNKDGGIFAIPISSEGEEEKIVTVVARRDAANNYFLGGRDLRNLGENFFKALPGLAKDLQRNEFKAKHAEKLSEARKEASEGQAQSLLKRLGLDDLL